MATPKLMRPLSRAGLCIGIGMGGFIDGILLHQIFQFHSMLSNQLPPDTIANLQTNMAWDGIFHGFLWLITALGIFLLWRVARRGEVPLLSDYFFGSILLGYGLFNLIEGLIDHHILEIHHVVQRATGTEQFLWDIMFLASGVIMIAVGILMRRTSLARIWH